MDGMSEDLDRRIRELFAGPLARFTAERDALAKELSAGGDADAARQVARLRKPVVPAWAVDRLAHEEPDRVAELLALGERLRTAQRRAMSGADVSALRDAMDDRRRFVNDLVRRAAEILQGDGVNPSSHLDDVRGTLEAATVDEQAAALVRSGRLSKPLAPPTSFEGGSLRVLEGGGSRASARAPAKPVVPDEAAGRERRAELRRLQGALKAAERQEAKAQAAVQRAKDRLAELDRRRAEAKEEVRAAESELRGATLERKRLAAQVQRSG